uniref:dATP/dGTP diphosphohydrolase MazZ domain-containing protein n=1 Tax=Vibrio phage Vc1 TaxID=1480731 RepID=A0A6M5CDZ7_9CAUD
MVRAQHAEWSDQTFGAVDKVGGVGCLKHLAKEAIEAAENPGDLSEWIWVHTYGIGKFKHTILRTVHDTEESAKFAQEVLGGEIVAYNKVPEVRAQHAEWSDQTFGAVDKVGGVGCLKHLAKEAIEAAENPGDLSEWADIQLLLWDAMRREESQTIS